MPDVLQIIIESYGVQAESGYRDLLSAYERFETLLAQTGLQDDLWLVMVEEKE